MPDFRELLYRDYSASFGTVKTYDRALAFRMFERAGRRPNLPRDTPIADIGCGKGEWLAWLQSHGFTNVRGFDVSAAELAFAEGVPVECGEVTRTLAAAAWRGNFGLIHAKDLIEHLTKQEVVDFLLASHAALRPGGLLWLSTFNAQSPFSTATRYGDFTHESGFTPTSLAQVLRATGFAVEEIAGLHVCPRTMGGRVRQALWRLISPPARLLLRARHGGHGEPGVESFSVAPDLFAIGRKPVA
jgi:2-polyprenyl-3-methyl-5-hydroxy-6-metoxy-1,4-benzoquinol methylase